MAGVEKVLRYFYVMDEGCRKYHGVAEPEPGRQQ